MLADWSTNANTRLTASPGTYGTTSGVAAQYATLHGAFITANDNLVAARAAGIRSSPLSSERTSRKLALLAFARPLYKQIQANTAVSDAAKIELGVVLPNVQPVPRPVPGYSPGILVTGVDGRLVKIRLFDPAHPTRKRFPADVNGAIVMSYVGATPSENPRDYKLEGPTSRVNVEILFPADLAPGTKVWLTATFFNERKQMGPACEPVGTQLNYGGSMPMAA